MFLPADSLIKGDGKDWRKTVVSSDVQGFHLFRIKGYQDSSIASYLLHCSKNGQFLSHWCSSTPKRSVSPLL